MNVSKNININKILYRMMQVFIVGINAMIFVPIALYKAGFTGLSSITYNILGFVCHQMPQRSFFLFGPKVMYSQAELLKNLQWSQMFTTDIRARFTCSDVYGCKFGVCARCTGMYSGMLIGMLSAGVVAKKKVPRVVLGALMLPMILDGGIQFIAAIVTPKNPFYESNNLLRLITGLVFGFGFGAFSFGILQEQLRAMEPTPVVTELQKQ